MKKQRLALEYKSSIIVKLFSSTFHVQKSACTRLIYYHYLWQVNGCSLAILVFVGFKIVS